MTTYPSFLILAGEVDQILLNLLRVIDRFMYLAVGFDVFLVLEAVLHAAFQLVLEGALDHPHAHHGLVRS